MTLNFDETAIDFISPTEEVYFKGRDGKEYPSYRAVRRAELEDLFKIVTDEYGNRVERYLAQEEIESILDRELGVDEEQ